MWEAIRTTKLLVANSVRSLSVEDAGYFGPGSVSWRIFSHASYGVSGIAAVLMQALHPVAMAAPRPLRLSRFVHLVMRT